MKREHIIYGGAAVLFLLTAIRLGYDLAGTRSGTGSSAGVGTSSSPQPSSGGHRALKPLLPDPSDPGSGASARFSGPPERPAPQAAQDDSGDDFAGIGSQSLLDLEPGVLPTADGLFERTVGQWAQDGFLALSVQEAASMLPLDPELPGHGGSLLDLVGGLPTREDVDRAFAYDSVHAQLEATCAAEVMLYALENARNPHFARDIEAQRRVFDADEDALMRELDRVSGYRNWSLLNRAFREFAK